MSVPFQPRLSPPTRRQSAFPRPAFSPGFSFVLHCALRPSATVHCSRDDGAMGGHEHASRRTVLCCARPRVHVCGCWPRAVGACRCSGTWAQGPQKAGE